MNFRTRRREDPQLDLTSLIDVVFLLLLFFIITTTFATGENQELPLDLPEANSGQAITEQKRLVIHVSQKGSIRVNDEQVRDNEVVPRLQALFEENPNQHLLIRGDKAATYGRVTEIIDEAKNVGFKKVNLVVKPK